MTSTLLVSVSMLKVFQKMGISPERVGFLMQEAGMNEESDRSAQTLLLIGLISALERISTLERESDQRKLDAMGDDL